MSADGDLRAWLEEAFARFVGEAPENLLPGFEGRPIFDAPVLGVADGDDPLFNSFRTAVGPRHLEPRSFLESRAPRPGGHPRIRVVVWALPFSDEVRASNRGGDRPSPLYSLARNLGGALVLELSRRLARAIRDLGFAAEAPALSEACDAFRDETYIYSSTWSERHAAFAAGLGQFGLNGSLITPLGSHVRLGSLITSLPLEASPGPPESGYRAACRENPGLCGRCVDRCPAGAISDHGLDKVKCNGMRKTIREEWLASGRDRDRILPTLQSVNGRRTWRHPLGCALCQCGIPCEGSDPFRG
jgi:epoxyqueuosine reductase